MTTEKSQDPVTILKLPSECFDEIFKHLKFDRRSLYSCLFVNRFWCRKVIPIIWRRPMPYNPIRKNIINIGVFIPFFNEEETSFLINEGIDISELPGPFPLFNYAQYIHILDIGAIEKATEAWMKNYNASKLQQSDENLGSSGAKDKFLRIKLSDCSWKELGLDDGLSTVIKTEKPVSRATSVLADSLCRMFMRCALNLKYLILSADKDIPKSSIFIDNEPGLVNLRKLKLRFFTNSACKHDRRGNLYDLIKSLPNICNGIVHLDINRIKIPNYMISEILAGLIMSQPELTYCRFYKVFGYTYTLISVLPVHKLTNLVLDDMNFTDISLAPLSQCTKLEALVLRKCRSLTLESIQPILKASIRLKFLHLSELPKDVMKAIIVKANDALEQVSVKFSSIDINEGLETLVKYCQNTTHLSLSTNEEQVNISNVISLINLLKNLSHLKLSFGATYVVELDNEFSNLELEKLQYLELINMDVKVLQGYLSKCRSPLTTVIMGVDVIEDRHINIFLEFSKAKNTLRWVGLDFIHDISSLDKYLETCKKFDELAQGYFQVFPAKQVRIREKYF